MSGGEGEVYADDACSFEGRPLRGCTGSSCSHAAVGSCWLSLCPCLLMWYEETSLCPCLLMWLYPSVCAGLRQVPRGGHGERGRGDEDAGRAGECRENEEEALVGLAM